MTIALMCPFVNICDKRQIRRGLDPRKGYYRFFPRIEEYFTSHELLVLQNPHFL